MKSSKNIFSIEDLTGQMLVAVPGTEDERFKETLILICAHSEQQGAMGLVLNKPLQGLTFNELIKQMGMHPKKSLDKVPLLEGGPQEVNRGFVLHSPDYHQENTIRVTPAISMTATADIIRAIALDQGPKDYMISLGYAGWESGQLENEMIMHGWLVTKPKTEVLFDVPMDMRWRHALESMGMQPHLMKHDVALS